MDLALDKTERQEKGDKSPGACRMTRPCNDILIQTLDLVNRMIEMADEGDLAREDAGCGVLYGILRDSAFKIKKLAEEEKEAHMRKGWWEQH